MPTDLEKLEAQIAATFEAAKLTTIGQLRQAWPTTSSENAYTVNLIVVAFDREPKTEYKSGLAKIPGRINGWLNKFSIQIPNWKLHAAQIPGPSKGYSLLSIVNRLKDSGYCNFDGHNAWYIFLDDPTNELNLYGTVGGDWFGQTEGQVPGRLGFMRVPGISFFMTMGIEAITNHETGDGVDGFWTANRAYGAVMHELMHNLALIPCTGSTHGPMCVMTGRLYNFPSCILEHTGGSIWIPESPNWGPGDEIQTAIGYKFFTAK